MSQRAPSTFDYILLALGIKTQSIRKIEEEDRRFWDFMKRYRECLQDRTAELVEIRKRM
jgi:hypothetical protein